MLTKKSLKEVPLSPLKPLNSTKTSVLGRDFVFDNEDKSLIENYQKTKCNKSITKILDICSKYIDDQKDNYRGYQNQRISLEDIKNEIIIGFIEAINNFDLNSSHTLISYSYLYIKGSILNYVLNNKYNCRIPKTKSNKFLIFKINELKKFYNIENNFLNDLHIKDIEKSLKTSKETIISLLNQLSKNHLSFDHKFESDDSSIDEYSNAEFELLRQDNKKNSENKIISGDLNNHRINILKKGLNFLGKTNIRQKNIIIDIYFKNASIDTLSKKYKVSKPRISLIKKQATENLKKFFKKNDFELLNFLEG